MLRQPFLFRARASRLTAGLRTGALELLADSNIDPVRHDAQNVRSIRIVVHEPPGLSDPAVGTGLVVTVRLPLTNVQTQNQTAV